MSKNVRSRPPATPEDKGSKSGPNSVAKPAVKAEDVTQAVAPNLRQRILAEVAFFTGLLAFMFVFMTLIWGHYKIPSESMQPTLEVGDHLYVSKFAYGYSRHSLPFNAHKLSASEKTYLTRIPKRGDVVVFRNPRSGIVMIKRLIGLPGDKIQVSGGRIILNGQMIDRQAQSAFFYREHLGSVVSVDKYQEHWPGEDRPHYIYEKSDSWTLDNTPLFTVPEGHYFMMGDNRDNSVDSRDEAGPGFVPQSHLIGRAELMMFSFKRCAKEDGLTCPPFRFMKKL